MPGSYDFPQPALPASSKAWVMAYSFAPDVGEPFPASRSRSLKSSHSGRSASMSISFCAWRDASFCTSGANTCCAVAPAVSTAELMDDCEQAARPSVAAMVTARYRETRWCFIGKRGAFHRGSSATLLRPIPPRFSQENAVSWAREFGSQYRCPHEGLVSCVPCPVPSHAAIAKPLAALVQQPWVFSQ